MWSTVWCMILPTGTIDHLFTNHPPKDAETAHRLDKVTETIHRTAAELAELLPETAADFEGNMMLEHLQIVSMFAKAGIARHQG